MLLFALITILCLCVMPLAAVLNIEIEKPLRNKGLRPKTSFKTGDDIMVLPQPKVITSTPHAQKAA
jgi:hypothetical protein